MGGILQIFDFLNRGQRLRRGQPSEDEQEDRLLKNKLLLKGHNRAELSSVLTSLDRLDDLKKQGLTNEIEHGEGSDAEYVHREQRRREEDRQNLVDTRTAQLKRLNQNPQDPELNLNDDEVALMKEHGINIPAGDISTLVFNAATALEGREISASRPGSARKGQFLKLVDDNGRIVGAWNPATEEYKDNPVPGSRSSGMSPGEMDRRGMLRMMGHSIRDIKEIAARNKSSIGYFQGKWKAGQRLTTGVSQDVDDLFHISDNLADVLLRARSGAQINEQEYQRLRYLVPNPRGPEEKFFHDLGRFEMEFLDMSSGRDLDTPNAVSPNAAPPGGKSPNLRRAVKDFLGSRKK